MRALSALLVCCLSLRRRPRRRSQGEEKVVGSRTAPGILRGFGRVEGNGVAQCMPPTVHGGVRRLDGGAYPNEISSDYSPRFKVPIAASRALDGSFAGNGHAAPYRQVIYSVPYLTETDWGLQFAWGPCTLRSTMESIQNMWESRALHASGMQISIVISSQPERSISSALVAASHSKPD